MDEMWLLLALMFGFILACLWLWALLAGDREGAMGDEKGADILRRGHCPTCYYESGLRVVNDPGHKHIPHFFSQTSNEPTLNTRGKD